MPQKSLLILLLLLLVVLVILGLELLLLLIWKQEVKGLGSFEILLCSYRQSIVRWLPRRL